MVETILLLIIAILLAFIVWLYKEFILISPPSVDERKPEPTTSPKRDSIVGSSRSVVLKPPPPKPKKKHPAQMPPEEVERAFLDNDFEEEHDDTSPINDIPEEERTEVVDTERRVENSEDVKLQRSICLDYEQILTSTTKVVRNEPLDINDAETLRKLENTDIGAKIKQAMPTYQAIVAAKLAEVEKQ